MAQQATTRQVVAEAAYVYDGPLTVRQVIGEVAYEQRGLGQETRARQVVAEVAWIPMTGDLYALGNDLGDYEGDERGVPLSSDRSAWDDVAHPEVHARDLKDGHSIHHLPASPSDGDAALWDATLGEWLPADVLTPDEHTAIGDSTPHHARAHTLDSETDHTDVENSAKADGRVLVWRAMAGKHVYEEQAAGAAPPAAAPAGYAENIGDGVNTSFLITHDLATFDVLVQVYDTSGVSPVQVYTDVDIVDLYTVRVYGFVAVPAVDQYRVLIVATVTDVPDAVTLSAEADDFLALVDQEFDLDTQTANTVFAGPVSGAAAKPTFRSLVEDDLPAHAHVEADITDLGPYADAAHTHPESDITDLDHTDPTAIHDNVAGEIHAVGAKATPVGADEVLIEDSEDAWAKKRIPLTDLLGGGGVDAGDVTYTPAVATDWAGDADPGDVDNALDQLAERVDDLEATPPGGVSTFVGLTDTPASYAGQGGKYVAVKVGEDGLEFL